ncbi:MAG: hypothetical protein QM755_02080 [Luteolibacter sp.]
MPLSRSYLVKSLLWLAVILMAIGQCLPWECVPVNIHHYLSRSFPQYSSSLSYVEAISITKQIPHVWTFDQSRKRPSFTDQELFYNVIRSESRSPHDPPKEIQTYLMQELWTLGRGFYDSSPSASHLLSTLWPGMLLAIWPVAFLALLAMPFLTGPLGHSRTTLWTARYLAFTMLVWLIRNLVLAFGEQAFPEVQPHRRRPVAHSQRPARGDHRALPHSEPAQDQPHGNHSRLERSGALAESDGRWRRPPPTTSSQHLLMSGRLFKRVYRNGETRSRT